jgi:hypothetical protein
MKNTTLSSIVFWLLWIMFGLICPFGLRAQDQKPSTNVNSRYEVEKVEISGIAESKISKALRDDMQKLVGEKYDQDAAQKLADRMRKELRDYSVNVKAKRGDTPDHVKVVFEAERTLWKRFEIPVPPVVYESKEGMNGAIEIPIDFQPHSVFTFGFVDSADELLERNAGVRMRLENRKVGTDLIQAQIEFNAYHETFNAATQAALAISSGVPGVYRARQDFAPSVSVIPFRDLKLSIGASFERLQMQYPVAHTLTAYAGTADVQFKHNVRTQSGYRHRFSASYSLRSATQTLDSDFIYTRHFATVDYTITKGRNLFGAHVQGGLITGIAPLFERFSLGDSLTLRGWNKFDVAPLGGTRSLHGSLEYRYRSFQLFYDVGTVYDPGKAGKVRHGLGFGWADKNGFFASLAFPVRLHQVVPMFMLGFRY